MKRLFFSLTLVVILALAIAGCAGTEEQGNAGIDQTGEESTPGAVVVETPVTEDTQAGLAATEEGATTATEEPEAGVVETPPSEGNEESAQAAAPSEEEVLPPTGTINLDHMSNLLDFEVWNHSNEQIGDVNAIVINQDTSEIEYVIIGTGGFLGLAEKEIPVPWPVLEVEGAINMEAESNTQTEETQAVETPFNVFILDMNQDELEQAPEFDLNPLYEPETADAASLQQLEQEIHSLWPSDELNESSSQTDTADEMAGSDQTATEESDQMTQTSDFPNLVLAEDLLGATVQEEGMSTSDQSSTEQQQDVTADQSTGDVTQQDADQANLVQNLGRVEEITVDLDTGKMNYLLVTLTPAPAGSAEQAPTGNKEQPSLGVGEDPLTGIQEPQLVPVPLQTVDWNVDEQVLIYTGSQALEEAPAISLEEFQSGQTNWQSDADSFWGQEHMMDSENNNQSDSEVK